MVVPAVLLSQASCALKPCSLKTGLVSLIRKLSINVILSNSCPTSRVSQRDRPKTPECTVTTCLVSHQSDIMHSEISKHAHMNASLMSSLTCSSGRKFIYISWLTAGPVSPPPPLPKPQRLVLSWQVASCLIGNCCMPQQRTAEKESSQTMYSKAMVKGACQRVGVRITVFTLLQILLDRHKVSIEYELTFSFNGHEYIL